MNETVENLILAQPREMRADNGALREEIRASFGSVERRIDALERRMDELDAKVDGLAGMIATLTGHFLRVEERVPALEAATD